MASSDSIKPQQIFKLLSQSGKVSRRYAQSWNVQGEQWTTYHQSSHLSIQHMLMVDEILTNEVILEDQSSVIHKAKLKDLASWAARKVYDAVTNSGQLFITVRWVVTEKNING